MNYQQFISEVKEKVEQILGDSLHVGIQTTLKNNGQERTGLTISENNFHIFPTIYLEEFYEQFQNEHTIRGIAESIVEIYHEIRFEKTLPIDMIQNFELAKPNIAYRIISTEQNAHYLSLHPHKTFLDFSIVFFILLQINHTGTGTVAVSHKLKELWNISTEELYETAKSNMPRLLPAELKPMDEIICELLGKECYESSKDNPMYVLTNPLRTFGASCILYEGILKQIGAHLGENYYVIPGSIHEMIIIPESKSPSKWDLEDMIMEINETQNLPEEFLSDKVYYYDTNTEVLK